MKKAAVAGMICVDVIPAFENHIDLLPGRLYECGRLASVTGGAVSNTGTSMHILGTPVKLISKIGDDDFGKKIISILHNRQPGLEDHMMVIPGGVTPYTIVISIPGIDRFFFHNQGENATFCSQDVKWETIQDCALFHFGYPAFTRSMYINDGAALTELYRDAKSHGLTTSMDPGMPDPSGLAGKADWRGILKRTLPFVDVFMPSADELLYMLAPDKFGKGDNLSPEELSELGDELLAMGVAVAAIKLGARGMYIRTASASRLAAMGPAAPEKIDEWADREAIFPIYKESKFCGATGAGDSSIAGFLCSLLRGLSLENAGLMAAAVGSCNVEASDSLSGVQSWEKTTARIEAGWETKAISVEAPSWKQASNGIWWKK